MLFVSLKRSLYLPNTLQLVFEIRLPNSKVVFMSLDVGFEKDERAIIIADATKFLSLWRSNPYGTHNNIANGNPFLWKQDYKFKHAEEGFSAGEENPVPLASIHFQVGKTYKKFCNLIWSINTIQYVSFTDGVTRTIWLLSNKCFAFPIVCGIKESNSFHSAVSVSGCKLYRVIDLVDELALGKKRCLFSREV